MRPRLSASSLWRAEKCPASTVLPPARFAHADGESGRKDHGKLEWTAPEGSIPEAAFAYDAEKGTARYLGSRLGRNYGQLGQNEIPGTADLVTVESDLVRIRDYKTGHGFMVAPPKENAQLGHNALCAALVHGKPEAIVEVEYTATGEVKDARLDDFDLLGIAARMRQVWRDACRSAALVEEGKQPFIVEGEHCWRCECYARCPAKTSLALAIGKGELPEGLPTLELTPQAVATGWERLKAVKKVLYEVERIYKGYAAENPVQLAGGKMLGEVEKVRDSLDGPVTFQVLRDLYGEQVARAAVEMETSKAALERALQPIAPPRGKAAMVREALAKIEEGGGVTKEHKRAVEEYEVRS
jgi:hypothetical protein